MARSNFLFLFLFSLFTSLGATRILNTDYDVIVIGGGPAGLSAVSALCRVGRRVIMFDSQEYRNAPTRNMHDVIGNDGTPPAVFRAAARAQIAKYDTVTMKNATITDIVPFQEEGFGYFVAIDNSSVSHTARRVILGTGVTDVLPSTPGVVNAFGRGMYWCPWCDGYEHREQSLGVLGPLSDALSSVLEMYNLNPDIVVLANGTDTSAERAKATNRSSSWREQLEAYKVPVNNLTIASIDRLQDGKPRFVTDKLGQQQEVIAAGERSGPNGKHYDRFRVNFTDGSTLERAAFIISMPTKQTSHLPNQLNLTMDESKIKVDPKMKTSLDGVYAVGDANSDGSTNVPHAMFSGKRAAVVVHVALAKEESLVAISKRSVSLDARTDEKLAMREVGDELEQLWSQARAQAQA